MIRRICIACPLIAFAFVAHAEPGRADLLAMIQSGDSEVRALARQWYARKGADAVEDLLPLLGHEREPVWRTVSNTLKDIVNNVAQPGRDSERERVAHLLLERLGQKPGADQCARILDVVPQVLRNGDDVGPMAALLDDAELRMPSRNALQLAGTKESRAALRTALAKSEGLFALALVDSLGMLRDDSPALRERLKDSDPLLRARAARALAWTGDSSLIEPIRAILASATTETYFDAADGLLRLGDAMLLHGGRYERAMELYAWALQNLDGYVLQGTAIAALGRFGDERALDWIVNAANQSKNGELDHAALEAFAILQGRAIDAWLIERHESLLRQFGPSIYGVYGRRGGPRFTPLLATALASGDAHAQRVAVAALLESNLPEAIRAVAEFASNLDAETAAPIANALELQAAANQRAAKPAAAAESYAGAYRLATADAKRHFALEGMMQFPSEDAYSFLMDVVGEDQWEDLPVRFLIGIARALSDAGRGGDAQGILEIILPRLRNGADIQAYLAMMQGDPIEIAQSLGFITDWHLIGPFPWPGDEGFLSGHVDPAAIDLNAKIPLQDKSMAPWQAHTTTGRDAIVPLTNFFGMATQAAAYAYASVSVDESIEGVLRIGSDDGVKVWVNGKVVHENAIDRGLIVDQDAAPISLKAGTNQILFQVTQGAGGWALCARITDAENRPIPFTQ